MADETLRRAAEQGDLEGVEAGIRLAGTLTIPQGKGPYPTLLLISGSGPQDRDETIFGHQPFLVLADHLARRGVAVLRTDDRGVGKSGGDFATATTADFATDAEAALAFLRARPEVDVQALGVLGHSEGGLIAPMLAARDSSLTFIVLLAGPALDGIETLVLQKRRFMQAGGPPTTRSSRWRPAAGRSMPPSPRQPTAPRPSAGSAS